MTKLISLKQKVNTKIGETTLHAQINLRKLTILESSWLNERMAIYLQTPTTS